MPPPPTQGSPDRPKKAEKLNSVGGKAEKAGCKGLQRVAEIISLDSFSRRVKVTKVQCPKGLHWISPTKVKVTEELG